MESWVKCTQRPNHTFPYSYYLAVKEFSRILQLIAELVRLLNYGNYFTTNGRRDCMSSMYVSTGKQQDVDSKPKTAHVISCGCHPFTGLNYWTGIFLVRTHSKVIFLVLHILSFLLSLKVKGLYKTFSLLLE